MAAASIRCIGFCGVDDSIEPKMLGLIAKAYPFVEFGVLFRPDKVCLFIPLVASTHQEFNHPLRTSFDSYNYLCTAMRHDQIDSCNI
jgi:hypothetical protein